MLGRDRKGTRWKKVLFLFLCIGICFLVILGVAFSFGIIKITKVPSLITKRIDTSIDKNKEVFSDSDYYHSSSTVIAEYDVGVSKNIESEAEVYENFWGRGFDNCNITTEYEIDGSWHKDSVISDLSSNIHPIYQTYYVSSAGDIWVIFEINGSVVANPVFYNIQENLERQLIVSESEIIISYSNSENKFYETIPKETELDVIVIDRIDNNSLDGLAEKIISGL